MQRKEMRVRKGGSKTLPKPKDAPAPVAEKKQETDNVGKS